MEDGTMVVVEGGAKAVGDLIQVEITKTHQTSAGKMLFGEVAHQKASASNASNKTSGPRLAARRTTNGVRRMKR
jgi:hypothetical protein